MKIKLPKNLKRGLKIFGIVLGLSLLTQSVDAILKPSASNPLPVSKISDEFPESYKRYIDNLKKIYPNAIFKAVYTNLDWNTALKHECYEVNTRISTIPMSYPASWKMNGQDIIIDGTFVAASKSAVAYVLDPRNSLYEKRIFQFEGLTYNENITPSVIEKVIVGSPLVGQYEKKYKNAGVWVDMDLSYAEIIDKVGKETKVSSVYIASRMIQETSGNILTNESVNGSNKTYPGVYNFFNIGSVPNADGTGAVTNGLKHAKEQGWTTPYLSILGGVTRIKASYIDWGQDTVYFQKFDVNNPYGNASWLMGTQYQTNIRAPISESIIAYTAYQRLDMLDTAFVFYIPVYNNMPEDPTPYPAGDKATFIDDNTKVYLEHPDNEKISVRTSANSEISNVIYEVPKNTSNSQEKIIATRLKKGNGYDWDLVQFEIGGEKIRGYVWNDHLKVYEYIKVENIILDKQNVELEVDEKLTLLATVMPENSEFKDVIWTSSNENILTIDNGVITAKAPGEVVVTVTTEDQGKTVTCTVTVKEKTYDITTDKEEYTIEQGQVLTPVVTLKNIEDYELKVENETIAKVVDKNIEALAPGETNIEIKGVDTEIVKIVKLVVTEKKYAIYTDKEEYVVTVGNEVTPNITLENIENYSMEIIDTNVAVLDDGIVKGITVGETTLKIIAVEREVVKEIKITVIPADKYTLKESIKLDEVAKTLTGISEKVTVADFKKMVELTNLTMNILNMSGTILEDNSFVGTDTTVTFLKNDSIEYDKLTINICGDVTGDGEINSADLLKTVKYLKEPTKVTINKFAADVTKDQEINSADLLKTVKYLKNPSDNRIDFN